MHDQALIDAQKPAAVPGHEAQLAVAVHGEAGVVAVAPGVVSADGWRYGRILEAADAAKLLTDDVSLQLQLLGIGDVLPLAAATDPKVRAGRLNPVLRGGQHLHNASDGNTLALAVHLHHDLFAGDAVIGEDDLSIVTGEGAAFVGDVFQGYADAVGLHARSPVLASRHGTNFSL